MFLNTISKLLLQIPDFHLPISILLFELPPPLLYLSNHGHPIFNLPLHLLERPLQAALLILCDRELMLEVYESLLVVRVLPHSLLHREHLLEVLVALHPQLLLQALPLQLPLLKFL
jgi:hypothetical protein